MNRRRASLVLAAAGLLAGLPAGAGATTSESSPVVKLQRVEAVVETPPSFDDEEGGDADADDPAIFVRAHDTANSVVLGTLKNGGLEAYDLSGALLQHIDTPPPPEEGLEPGRFNNVDVISDVAAQEYPDHLAVVTDRGRDRLRIYRIDEDGAAATGPVLTDVTDPDSPRLFSRTEAKVEEQATGYGLALRSGDSSSPWAVVSRRHRTAIGLFQLLPTGDGTVTYAAGGKVQLPTTFTLPNGDKWTPCEDPGEGPQVEGMVVDFRDDTLYAAQEDVGIWRIPLKGGTFGRPTLVEKVREYGFPATYDPDTEECVVSGPDPGFGGSHLSADAEGLTIAYQDNKKARLFASSQGDSTFSIFKLIKPSVELTWVRSFEVVNSEATDSVEHSDGAAVVTTGLKPDFKRGLVVVHDGENTPVVLNGDGEPRPNTNFKFLRYDDLH